MTKRFVSVFIPEEQVYVVREVVRGRDVFETESSTQAYNKARELNAAWARECQAATQQ